MALSNGPASSGRPKIVVMGVSGCGKSTIGVLIARALDVPFVDADDLHPLANIEKMAAGTRLTDEDRWPWLATVGGVLAQTHGGTVVACSALRRAYRDAILSEAPETLFVHLEGTKDILRSRLEGRSDHFMPPALLDSQLATLEPLGADEPGIVLDIATDVPTIIATAVARISHALAGGRDA